MNIHKSSRLTPIQRKEICSRCFNDRAKVSHLAGEYHVNRPAIYKDNQQGQAERFLVAQNSALTEKQNGNKNINGNVAR